MIDVDRPEIRILTFADHAVVAPDGKLYMNGAGIDQFYLQAVPQQVGPLYLAIRLRIPWAMTGEQHELTVRVLDEDRGPVAPDPFVKAGFEVGRAPGQRPGDELALSLAVPVVGVTAQREGTIYFHLHLGDQRIATLPLKLAWHPLAQMRPRDSA